MFLNCTTRNAITNFRSFPYLDFEFLFPQVRKTCDFANLRNRRFKNKTAVKLVIKYNLNRKINIFGVRFLI